MAKQFTSEQDDWIKANHSTEETVKSLTIRFNAEFNENRSKDSMKHHIWKLHLKQRDNRYSEEQDLWLIENAPCLSVSETAKLFNVKFNCDRSDAALKIRCNKVLGVVHKHDRNPQKMQIGEETICGGYVMVKVADTYQDGFYKNWKFKHRIVWEQHYGSLPPKNKQIVFLDRNRKNCSIENLYAIDKRVLREMIKKKWFSTIPEKTMAAIKLCELMYISNDILRGKVEEHDY